MAGANLTYRNSPQAWQQILTVLEYKTGEPGKTRQVAIKNGAPVTNTAADAPNAVSDFCFDFTNKDVYISTLFTNPTTHTWVKISP